MQQKTLLRRGAGGEPSHGGGAGRGERAQGRQRPQETGAAGAGDAALGT